MIAGAPEGLSRPKIRLPGKKGWLSGSGTLVSGLESRFYLHKTRFPSLENRRPELQKRFPAGNRPFSPGKKRRTDPQKEAFQPLYFLFCSRKPAASA
jgi:hypothetical protein